MFKYKLGSIYKYMNVKLLGILLTVLFLASFTFAADPVFTGDIYIDNNWNASDYNYYDFDVNFYSGVVSDADEDLNTDSCEVSFNDGFTWGSTLPPVVFDSDTNRCVAILDYEWGNTGEVNVMFRISDDAAGTTTSTDMNWYLDNTAPVTTATHSGSSTVTVVLTSTDSGTPNGDGSGFKSIYYWVDDVNYTSSTNPLSISFTTPGYHTVEWCALDNLDNNECVESGVWSKTVYVGTVQNSACGILNLVVVIIAALILIAILIIGLNSGLDAGAIIPLVVMAIVSVICIIIISNILSPVCAVV